ncbi:MAG: hypothetical protein ACOCP8_03635 [archaeon]
MSYLSTKNSLVGRYKVKRHAVSRLRKRKGDICIGNKKIKNMGHHKLEQLIIKSLRERKLYIKEQANNNALKVKTRDFTAVVVPGFHNHVITIY